MSGEHAGKTWRVILELGLFCGLQGETLHGGFWRVIFCAPTQKPVASELESRKYILGA